MRLAEAEQTALDLRQVPPTLYFPTPALRHVRYRVADVSVCCYEVGMDMCACCSKVRH